MNEMRKLMEAADYSPEGDIVASAGEFIVVEEHGMIHIIDGEQVVRLSMQKPEWEELTHNAYRKGFDEGYAEGHEAADTSWQDRIE